MPQVNDFKKELREARSLRLPWYVTLLIICIGAPVTFFLASYDRLAIALPLLNTIGILGFMVALKWRFRKKIWFWMLMTIITVIHIILLSFVPWAEKWVPALAIGLIDSFDICAIIWIFMIVERFSEGKN
jgi:hypothetical protein